MFMFTTVNVVKDKEIELSTHLLLDCIPVNCFFVLSKGYIWPAGC